MGVVLVAAIVAGVAVLAGSGSGGGSGGTSSLTVGVERPPPPPRGALVLAGESGSRAVALAVGRRRLTATVLSPDGSPLSGLNVSFRVGSRVVPAHPCGNGCYAAVAAPASRVEVRPSGSRPVLFRIPATAPGATAVVARAARVYRSLHTLVYLESLRSGPTGGVLTTWRLKAPNELQYTIRGGADSVVLGERRWDRDKPGAPWRRSRQIPALRVPLPAWGSVATYCGYPAEPVYYDYGSNVVYQDDTVYMDGNPAYTAGAYTQQATELAAAGKAAAPPGGADDWQPLGVFALVQGEETAASNLFQLAVNQEGVIRGNYYNVLSDITQPVYGSVDKKTQRAAWTVGDRKEPIYEAGFANLTRSETTLLVHFGKDRTQQWTLIRVDPPAEKK